MGGRGCVKRFNGEGSCIGDGGNGGHNGNGYGGGVWKLSNHYHIIV